MFYRKDAVSLAVLSLLASSGLALADNTQMTTGLSLDPQVIHADDAATAAAPAAAPDRAPLMWALYKVGLAKPLDSVGLNIYGFVESGYTWNHRHAGTPIAPGPFNIEYGNHYMLNQVDLRFERDVDSTKWDVGGMVELMYGTDAAGIHSNGLEYGNNDSDSRVHPQYQFDITQAFVDVNIPVGTGLKIRAGKFVALAGYETIDPRGNPFYSHSYLFSSVPGTQTGVLGFYTLNDQWSVIAGVSRGWDQATEDSNGSPDALGEVTFTPNKQWAFIFNWIVGPEDYHDTSHYRALIDPIVTWQVTDALKLSVEALYDYDGGIQGDPSEGLTHAYGDAWGAAAYASYTVNDYLTVNFRGEGLHTYLSNSASGIGNINVYEATLGVTITPLPKDPLGKNLIIRPEVRYDFSEDNLYFAGNNFYKDQLTFAADVIFKF